MKGIKTLITGAKIVFWVFIVGIIIQIASIYGLMHGVFYPVLASAYYVISLIGLIGVLIIGYVLYWKNR